MPRKRALLKFCTGLLLRSSSGPHPAWGSLWGQLQTTGNLGNWAQEACLPSSVAERGHQNCPGVRPQLNLTDDTSPQPSQAGARGPLQAQVSAGPWTPHHCIQGF